MNIPYIVKKLRDLASEGDMECYFIADLAATTIIELVAEIERLKLKLEE